MRIAYSYKPYQRRSALKINLKGTLHRLGKDLAETLIMLTNACGQAPRLRLGPGHKALVHTVSHRLTRIRFEPRLLLRIVRRVSCSSWTNAFVTLLHVSKVCPRLPIKQRQRVSISDFLVTKSKTSINRHQRTAKLRSPFVKAPVLSPRIDQWVESVHKSLYQSAVD